MQMIFDTSAIEQIHGFALFLRSWWMEARDISAGLRQSLTSLVYKLYTDILFQPDERLHFENSFVQSSVFLICKLRSKRRVSSDHTSMENISAEVSIFCPWTNWIHLVTCSKIEFRDLHCYSRWTKSLKFTLSIAVHGGGLAKNNFWLVATQKKRIGEQLNYFWNMCPKPFSWAKNKRKLFTDGKSRRTALSESDT